MALRAGFVPMPHRAQAGDRAQYTEQNEDRAPADGTSQQCAQNRPQRRHEGQHRSEQPIQRGAFGCIGIDVTDRGEGRHQCRRRSHRLYGSPGQKSGAAAGQGQRKRRKREQQRPQQQDRASPDAVGQWAKQQLAQPERQQVTAQRELHQRRGCLQCLRHHRHHRKIDVHGQRGQEVERRHQHNGRRQRVGPTRGLSIEHGESPPGVIRRRSIHFACIAGMITATTSASLLRLSELSADRSRCSWC